MPQELVKWRVFCNTETKWTEKWLEPGEVPIECFVNNEHEIAPNSFQKIDETSINNSKIIEEEIPTGGFFRSQGFVITTPSGQTNTLDVSWKYPVGVLTSKIQTDSTDIGNMVDAIVGPNTIVGILTTDAAVGDTVLNVNSTVTANAHLGLEILINGEIVGEVISIETDTITITEPLAKAYANGSFVGGQKRIIKAFNLGYLQGCDIGNSKIGATYVPTGVITRIIYRNNLQEEKALKFNVEYLY